MASKNQQATGSGAMMTRHRGKIKAQEEEQQKQQAEDKKRRKTLFQSSKVIGPWDIPVDLRTGKIRIVNEEEDVKPKVELDDGGNPVEPVPAEETADVEEVVVKEEVEVPMDTAEEEEELGGTLLDCENSGGTEVNFEKPEVEEASAEAVDVVEPEVREDDEGAMDNSEKIHEENLILKIRLGENEARIMQLENQVKLLKQKNFEQEVRITALEKMVMVSEADSVGEPLQKVDNLSVNASILKAGVDLNSEENDEEQVLKPGVVFNTVFPKNVENSMEPRVEKLRPKTVEQEEAINALESEIAMVHDIEDAGEHNPLEKIDNLSNMKKLDLGEQNAELVNAQEFGVVYNSHLPNGGNPAEPEVNKVISLFPKVIGVMWEKHELSMLSRTDYLNLCLVCSAWKEGLDEIKATEKEITICHGNLSWKHGSTRRKRNFLTPPTKLTIVYRRQDRRSIEEMLAKYGRNIKKLKYHRARPCENYGKDWALFFVRCLEWMPNLANIGIGFQIKDRTEPDIDNINLPTGFPTLSKLEELNDANWPADLFGAALIANPHITSLTYKGNRNVNVVLTLPNLRKLDCTLRRLVKLNAPLLEHLILDCASGYFCNSPRMVHAALEKFSHSLQILKIGFRHSRTDLDFPNMLQLKKLILTGSTKTNYTTFILRPNRLLELVSSCPSLEHLVLENFIGCNCTKRERCDCCTKGKEVEESAIRQQMETEWVCKLWEALPKLTKVEITQPPKASAGLAFQFVRESRSD